MVAEFGTDGATKHRTQITELICEPKNKTTCDVDFCQTKKLYNFTPL